MTSSKLMFFVMENSMLVGALCCLWLRGVLFWREL